MQRLIRQATFSDPAACLENVEYLPDRKLKKEELLRLGTCNYIHEHHNVILVPARKSCEKSALRQMLTYNTNPSYTGPIRTCGKTSTGGISYV